MDCKIISWRQKKNQIKTGFRVLTSKFRNELDSLKATKKTKDDWSNKSVVPVGSCNKSSLCIWDKPPFL